MEKHLTVWDFLLLVEAGEYSSLEIYNYVEDITSNFSRIKVELLLKEVDVYIFERKEDFYASNQEKLKGILFEYHQENKELPYKELPDLDTFISKEEGCAKTIQVLDTDKLMGNEIHYRLYQVYGLKKLLQNKIKLEITGSPMALTLKDNIDLKQFLTDEGVKILPDLLTFYNGVKKKEYAIMFLALKDLNLLTKDITAYSHIKIVEILKNTFGPKVGERAMFNKTLTDYGATSDLTKIAEINRHKKIIWGYLENYGG